MNCSIPFERIIKARAERASVQGDWNRQRATAQAISTRFADGHDAVLLADEVGMGKTYVALAVMADYLMQSERNDRKVLLITPPSHVLKHKWVEEIASFNGKYVCRAEDSGRKDMRPLNVSSYWDLFRNLHDYEDTTRLRVDKGTLHSFLHTLFGWAKSRDLLGKQPRLWPVLSEFDILDNANLRFTAQYSQAAIREFLESEYAVRKGWFQEQFQGLKTSTNEDWPLANLFKRFAAHQDRFEPNVYVMNMSALSAPRINEAENKLFSQFVLGFLLSGVRADNRMKVVRALEEANILRERVRYARWQEYVTSVLATSREDMYGLRGATGRVLGRADVALRWSALRAQLSDGGALRAFFNDVRNLVFQEKLVEANIGLAVIDEVHNWKAGKHNAEVFSTQYAPHIASKLIMSATPFQVEQGEMARVFNIVVRKDGKSARMLEQVFGQGTTQSGGLMRICLQASNKFALAWQALGTVRSNKELDALLAAREKKRIRQAAQAIVDEGHAQEAVEDFAAALLAYRNAIETLQAGLRGIVIRHTKPRNKRDFRIGRHFHDGHPDGLPRSALYRSDGYGGEDAAMVNFIGMRLGQFVERERGRTKAANARLLGGLSSSTSAYLHGASARRGASSQQRYQAMFTQVLDETAHPKVEASVTRAFENFVQGRKTLIFCERVQTLGEIEAALTRKIDAWHQAKAGAGAMRRKSLLKRADLVDNLWWLSLGDASGRSEEFAEELTRRRETAGSFVQACLVQAGIKPSARRIIRLLDAYMLAPAMTQDLLLARRWPRALRMFAGLHDALTGANSESRTSLLQSYVNGAGQTEDERSEEDKDDDETADGADALRVLDAQYRDRQNLWCAQPRPAFHGALWDLLEAEAARLLAGDPPELPLHAFADILLQLMAGLRRVALRDDLIARYEALPGYQTHFERISAGLATMEVGHGETMLARTVRFIEGLAAEEGSISQADQRESKRRSMWSGILRRDVKHVSTLSGATGNELRARLCASFNSPLLPDILVCSAIGSEGIDLHRDCADIIIHDLPWNPAKLEQRIGRLDRVNSLADPSRNIRIRIGIPYLANNYEQFQYDVVFSRAQTFEVLLGTPNFGDGDIDEEVYGEGAAVEAVREGEDGDAPPQAAVMPALPEPMIEFLKMDLAVVGQAHTEVGVSPATDSASLNALAT
jgi:predicted transcriptional regulator